jgi:ATP-dependent DNA helicase RecQ
LEDIYAYFQEGETDDIDEAIDELSEYEETEVRLVRIKFLSDMAN